jgi:hypothetical protein
MKDLLTRTTRNYTNARELRKQQQLAKSNQLLELYKQGLTYQDIGSECGVSRERVRQILDQNPAFHQYLREREEGASHLCSKYKYLRAGGSHSVMFSACHNLFSNLLARMLFPKPLALQRFYR